MAQNLITLADLYVHFVNSVQGEFDASIDDLVPMQLFNQWVSEAYIEINRTAHIYRKRKLYDIARDDKAKALPDDLLDRLILPDGVTILDAQGRWTNPALLEPFSEFAKIYGPTLANAANEHGPAHFGFADYDVLDTGDGPQFVFMPPAADTVTSGLIVDYVAHPGYLSRFITKEQLAEGNDIVGTGETRLSGPVGSVQIRFGDGTAYIDFIGASWLYDTAANISIANQLLPAVGQYIGLRTADETALPARWYRCTGLSNVTSPSQRVRVAISPDYSGFSYSVPASADSRDVAESYVVTEASPLEIRRPGLIRYAPLEYVKWQMLMRDESAEAARGQEDAWLKELLRIKSQANTTLGSRIPEKRSTAHSPALRR